MPDYHAALKSHLISDNTLLVTTFAIRAEGVGIDPDPSAGQTVDALAAWMEVYRDGLSSGYRWDSVTVEPIPPPGVVHEHVVDSQGSQGYNGSAIPAELCGVISLRTNHTGRSGRGRIFFPSPLNGNVMTDNKTWAPDTDYWSALANMAEALIDGHTFSTGIGTDAHLSTRVWSRKNGETYDLTAAIPRRRIAWLRSRSTTP